MLNRVCAALDETGSEARIGTFAYAGTIEPPRKTKLDDRVIVWFAPILMCYAHPFETCTEARTATHRRQLEDWTKVCQNFVQFDYPCNYDNYHAPYPFWAALQLNIQLFHKSGFIGLFNCTNMEFDVSFAIMNGWLYAKLLWDPYRDMDALYQEFLSGYYGEGWQYLREYIRITSEELTGQRGHFLCTESIANKGLLRIKGRDVKYITGLWENALALAKEGPQRTNLRRAALSYQVWKADAMRGEFSLLSPKRIQSNKQLLSDLWELEVPQHCMGIEDGRFITVEESEQLKLYRLIPRYWCWRQLGQSTKEAENFWQALRLWIFG